MMRSRNPSDAISSLHWVGESLPSTEMTVSAQMNTLEFEVGCE